MNSQNEKEINMPICAYCGSTRFKTRNDLDEDEIVIAGLLEGSDVGAEGDVREFKYCTRCFRRAKSESDSA